MRLSSVVSNVRYNFTNGIVAFSGKTIVGKRKAYGGTFHLLMGGIGTLSIRACRLYMVDAQLGMAFIVYTMAYCKVNSHRGKLLKSQITLKYPTSMCMIVKV
jgi:hypothetical protein